jgi:hypothetical protein
MLTANWLASDLCTSVAPDVMYGWLLQDEDAKRPPKNYTWPDTYTRQASFLHYSKKCFSTVKVDVEKECCVTSLNLTRSFGYQTTSTILVDSLDDAKFVQVAPKAANGAKYCGLRAKQYNANSTFGVDRLYVRANGECITPYGFRCFENNTIALYGGKSCSGNVTQIELSNDRKDLTFPRLGEMTGNMLVIDSAQSEFSWTALDRSFDYIPLGNHACDFVQMFCFILAFYLLAYSIYFHMRNAIRTKRGHPIMETIVQVFWLVHITLKYVSQFGLWNFAFDGSTYLFLMAASLGNTILSLNFFFIVNPRWAKFKIASIVFLVLVHFGLTWTQYTRFRLINMGNLFSPENVAIFTITLQVWFMIMYFGDCIPPLSVIHTIVRRQGGSVRDGLKELWETNRRVFVVVLMQFFIAILYVVQQNIRENSSILGHDRWWLTFFQVESLVHAMHSVCNVYLISNMVSFVKQTSIAASLQSGGSIDKSLNSSRSTVDYGRKK